ncbi:dTDP-glucose 4,6-dehydratase [Rhodococcus wratislaviensis]|uniref:Nucleotide-sugar epimerase n=1 Tax=Rhodococcus wratislaviensis TaxID=44752 RepID=A0AB38FD16_RHOWR|nr:NAD(P)-dependent oxidoreductase [Rhodococcus wratislaviensis]REE75465.1 dTDP-glucose 4,6-dehydratase [Rhodococcus wratislaviensis]SPZ39501.1 putative nucleotide-sugar epimerase [Rhodococcus wratislaviensis]
MKYLITGANGFVMSVFARHILEHEPDARICALDLNTPDDITLDYLGDTGRVEFHSVDVRDAGTMRAVLSEFAPEVVVHGATVTHVPRWEHDDPTRFIDINTMGTMNVLDAARRTASVRRTVLISSAAVYGNGYELAGTALPETSPPDPDEMYGISKLAGELIAHRMSTLYGMDIPILRFSRVFGPMERPTGTRATMSLPYHLARARTTNTSLRVTTRTLTATGDWISATDVATALYAICTHPSPCTDSFNIGSGHHSTVTDLVDLFKSAVTVDDSDGVDTDPNEATGKNGLLHIGRIAHATEWQPRPLADQIDEYVKWALAHSDHFD